LPQRAWWAASSYYPDLTSWKPDLDQLDLPVDLVLNDLLGVIDLENVDVSHPRRAVVSLRFAFSNAQLAEAFALAPTALNRALDAQIIFCW